MTDYLNNFSFRICHITSVIRNLDNYFVTCYCTLALSFWDIDVSAKLLIVRNYKSKTLTLWICSDKYISATLNNWYNLALTSFAVCFFIYNHMYLITVNGTSGLVCRYKNILVFSFHTHKSKSSLRTHKFSDKNITWKRFYLAFKVKLYLSIAV